MLSCHTMEDTYSAFQVACVYNFFAFGNKVLDVLGRVVFVLFQCICQGMGKRRVKVDTGAV
jgi:hypothetical protein